MTADQQNVCMHFVLTWRYDYFGLMFGFVTKKAQRADFILLSLSYFKI